MKTTKTSTMISLLFSLCLIFQSGASAQEKKLKMGQLPAAVRKTAQEQTKGATIKSIVKEKENGKTQYEVETLVNGKNRDMIIDEDGTLAEVEQQVDLSTLSAEVQKGITDNAGTAKILIIEAVSKGGNLEVYEVQIQKNGKKSGFQVKPDGSLVPKKKK